MSKEVNSCFKCVKITLIVLYVLSLIAVICLICISIFGLSIVTSANDHPDHELTPGEKEETKKIFTTSLIISAVSLVFLLIGLIGVIKENKIIIISIFVFGIIETVIYIVRGSIPLAFTELLSTILTGIYAKMIVDKQRYNNNCANPYHI